MADNNDLKKYIDFGLSGAPEIKGEEKRYWLGEFRERVIFAVTYEQIKREEALKVIQERIRDQRVDRMIVDGNLSLEIGGKLMEISKEAGKDYKTITSPDMKKEIAVVLASNEAVNEERVILNALPLLPDRYTHLNNKKLCKKHMQELREEAPLFADEFQEITMLDNLIGTHCGVCEKDMSDGVMM